MGVPEHLQRLEGRAGPVAHDGHVRFPIQPLVQEEPEVADRGGRSNPVVPAGRAIRQEEPAGGGIEASTRRTEIEQFRLGRLSREVVPPEPQVARTILLAKEGIDGILGGPASENDAVVHVHAQCSVGRFPSPGEQGRGVEGGEDR